MLISKTRLVISLILAALVMILSGCTVTTQSLNMVKGSGVTARLEVPIEKKIAGISVNTAIDVVLDGSLTGKAIIEADDNIVPLVRVVQSASGVIEVGFRENTNISPVKPVIVYVPRLSGGRLETLSAGNIRMKDDLPLEGDAFELHLASAGNITLSLNAERITVRVKSSGDVTLRGEADRAEIMLESAGDFNGFEFRLIDAAVYASSAGSAFVNVSGLLKAEVTSAGNIVYDGKPLDLQTRDTSSGVIRPR